MLLDRLRGLLALGLERLPDLRALGLDAADDRRALLAHLARRLAGDTGRDLRVALGRGVVDATATARLTLHRARRRIDRAADLARRRRRRRPALAREGLPVCVASLAASLTVLLVLPVAVPFHVLTLLAAEEPAEETLPRAAETAPATLPFACANAPFTAPSCCVPAAPTSRDCLATVCEIAAAVRVPAVFSRAASVWTASLIASVTSLRPSLIERRRSRARSRASRIASASHSASPPALLGPGRRWSKPTSPRPRPSC